MAWSSKTPRDALGRPVRSAPQKKRSSPHDAQGRRTGPIQKKTLKTGSDALGRKVRGPKMVARKKVKTTKTSPSYNPFKAK